MDLVLAPPGSAANEKPWAQKLPGEAVSLDFFDFDPQLRLRATQSGNVTHNQHETMPGENE